MKLLERIKRFFGFTHVGCGDGFYTNGKIGEKPKLKRPIPPKGQDVGDVPLYTSLADEYQVALMWRLQGQTQKKTAELMGVSQNKVKYLWRQAILNGDCDRRR